MKIGDTVICVDDTIAPHMVEEINNDFISWVKSGNQYTVRQLLDNDDIVTGVLLVEIRNPVKYFKLLGRLQEPAFGLWRFRKIDILKAEDFVSTEAIRVNTEPYYG